VFVSGWLAFASVEGFIKADALESGAIPADVCAEPNWGKRRKLRPRLTLIGCRPLMGRRRIAEAVAGRSPFGITAKSRFAHCILAPILVYYVLLGHVVRATGY